MRRPPRPTLFPTRRSSDLMTGLTSRVCVVVPTAAPLGAADAVTGSEPAASPKRASSAKPLGHVLDADLSAHVLELFTRRDRKSTRLNSSHVEISYAVFCLK